MPWRNSANTAFHPRKRSTQRPYQLVPPFTPFVFPLLSFPFSLIPPLIAVKRLAFKLRAVINPENYSFSECCARDKIFLLSSFFSGAMSIGNQYSDRESHKKLLKHYINIYTYIYLSSNTREIYIFNN